MQINGGIFVMKKVELTDKKAKYFLINLIFKIIAKLDIYEYEIEDDKMILYSIYLQLYNQFPEKEQQEILNEVIKKGKKRMN